MTPFGLSMADTARSHVPAAEAGSYDAEEQLWVGGSEAEAYWGCTGATVCVGPICYKYTRWMDVAQICLW